MKDNYNLNDWQAFKALADEKIIEGKHSKDGHIIQLRLNKDCELINNETDELEGWNDYACCGYSWRVVEEKYTFDEAIKKYETCRVYYDDLLLLERENCDECRIKQGCVEQDRINSEYFCTNIANMRKVYNKLNEKIFTVKEIKEN